MSFNPSDPFGSLAVPAPSAGGGSRGGSGASSLAGSRAGSRQGSGSTNVAGGMGSEKAQRMFAASQAAAAAQAAAEAAAPQSREGASASAFESRERNARFSILQNGQGIGMPNTNGGPVAFPMTDLVDAQNDKKIGLSFASLAVRDHHDDDAHQPIQPVHAQEGMVATQHHQPAKQAQLDPWAQSSFHPSQQHQQPQASQSVFRDPPVQQRPPQQQQPPRQAAPAAGLSDFDPLSLAFDMGNGAQNKGNSDPFGLGSQPKPKKQAPPPREDSSSEEEDEDEESEESEEEDDEDSDEEDEAAAVAAAAAEAARKKRAAEKAAKAKALADQRAKERAEAVAYDNARKAEMAAKRRSGGVPGASAAAAAPADNGSGGRMKSRALDAEDERQAADIVRNETDPTRLKNAGLKASYPAHVVAKYGSNPAAHWAYSKSKTRTSLMMPKMCVYWRFVWAGVRHEVELFHSTVSGKRTVRADGALVAQEKMFIDTGSRHDFTIGTGTNPCHVTVLICASGGEYAYELFIERVRFYQALQAWLVSLQNDSGELDKLEPLSPHALNTVGEQPRRRQF